MKIRDILFLHLKGREEKKSKSYFVLAFKRKKKKEST